MSINYVTDKNQLLNLLNKTKVVYEKLNKNYTFLSKKSVDESGNRVFTTPHSVSEDKFDKYNYMCIRPTVNFEDGSNNTFQTAIAVDIDKIDYLNKKKLRVLKDLSFILRNKVLTPNLIVHDRYYTNSKGEKKEYDLNRIDLYPPKMHLIFLLKESIFLEYKNIFNNKSKEKLKDNYEKLKYVEKRLNAIYDGDDSFSDILVKNCFDLENYKVLILNDEPYEIDKLKIRCDSTPKIRKINLIRKTKKKKLYDSFIDCNDEISDEEYLDVKRFYKSALIRNVEMYGVIRNTVIFKTADFLCTIYKFVKYEDVKKCVLELQEMMIDKYNVKELPKREIKSIVKSICKRLENYEFEDRDFKIDENLSREDKLKLDINRALVKIDQTKVASTSLVKARISVVGKSIDKIKVILEIIKENPEEFKTYFTKEKGGLKGKELQVFALEKYLEKTGKTIGRSSFFQTLKDLKDDPNYVFGGSDCEVLDKKQEVVSLFTKLNESFKNFFYVGDNKITNKPNVVEQFFNFGNDDRYFSISCSLLQRANNNYLFELDTTYASVRPSYLVEDSAIKYICTKFRDFLKTEDCLDSVVSFKHYFMYVKKFAKSISESTKMFIEKAIKSIDFYLYCKGADDIVKTFFQKIKINKLNL